MPTLDAIYIITYFLQTAKFKIIHQDTNEIKDTNDN